MKEVQKLTLAELHQSLGAIPLARIHMIPPLGTTTDEDLLNNNESDEPLCELINGILVEEAMGMLAAVCASTLARMLGNYVADNNLGFVIPCDGPYRMGLGKNSSRLPVVSINPWDRVP